MLYRPPGIGQPVRTEEVVVVVIVLLVWAMCVYVFFHQWGKLRSSTLCCSSGITVFLLFYYLQNKVLVRMCYRYPIGVLTTLGGLQ